MSRPAVKFRAATLEDADALAENLRPADRQELLALGLVDFRAAIRQSLHASALAATAEDEQGLVAVLGVAPLTDSLLAPIGAPWMMGTPRSALHSRTLVRSGPAYTRAMLAAYPRLMNMVWAGNTLHINWLRRLGFVFRPQPIRHPATGESFLVFEMSHV